MRICLVPLIPQHVAHVLAQPLVRPLDLCLMLMGDVALLVLLMGEGEGGRAAKGRNDFRITCASHRTHHKPISALTYHH